MSECSGRNDLWIEMRQMKFYYLIHCGAKMKQIMHLDQELKRQAKNRMRRRCAEKISMMNQMMMPMTTAFAAIKNRYH